MNLIFLITLVLALVLCEATILKADRLNAESVLAICKYAGIQFLLGAALTGIAVMINQICRNLGAGIAIGVCLSMFSTFITSGVNVALTYFKINVDVSEYWIIDLMSNCPVTGMDKAGMIRVIVSAIAWFVLALGIGIAHFRKVDVK